jgi:alkylation response protein AidB-like acyl-CoA dehydrogenase
MTTMTTAEELVDLATRVLHCRAGTVLVNVLQQIEEANVHIRDWANHANLAGIVVFDGEQPRMTPHGPVIVALVLHTSEVEIVDTWHSLGMRGTDSNDVVMKNVFVPASRTFPMVPDSRASAHHGGPLYRFPGIGAGVFCIGSVPLAVARGAIAELRQLAERKTALGFTRPLSERPPVQATLARAEAMLRAARLLYYDTLATAWERTVAGERHSLEQKADLLLAGAHAASTAATVTDMMSRVAGTTGIYAQSPLERHFRDAQTLRHHGFLSENRFETAGQVYFGVQPEFALVAF